MDGTSRFVATKLTRWLLFAFPVFFFVGFLLHTAGTVQNTGTVCKNWSLRVVLQSVSVLFRTERRSVALISRSFAANQTGTRSNHAHLEKTRNKSWELPKP